MSITPNLRCDETEPRSIHSPDTMNQIRIVKYPARFQGSFLSGKCILLGSVSSQQRFEVPDIKALRVSQLLGHGQTAL